MKQLDNQSLRILFAIPDNVSVERLNGEKLILKGDNIKQNLVDYVKSNKARVLVELDLEYYKEVFQERAAIYEFDGDLEQGEAEYEAFNDTLKQLVAEKGIDPASTYFNKFWKELKLYCGYN